MSTTPLRITKGSRGAIVAELQRALDVEADGVCGPVTMAAAARALGRKVAALELADLWTLGVDVHLGVDLSGHNEGGGKREVDFKALRAAGVMFAWLKLTEGRRYRNTEAVRQIAAARDAGILVGGYHFSDPSADPLGMSRDELLGDAIRAEAPHFLETQAEFFGAAGPDLVPMLDIEAGYASALKRLWASSVLGRSSAARAEATATWCRAWLDTVDAVMFGRPNGSLPASYIEHLRASMSAPERHAAALQSGIYTARWAVQAYLSAAPAAALQALQARPLWLASYNAGAEPARPLPHPWRPCHVWQCSGSGELPGVDGRVDLSLALGSDLRALTIRSPA